MGTVALVEYMRLRDLYSRKLVNAAEMAGLFGLRYMAQIEVDEAARAYMAREADSIAAELLEREVQHD